MFSVDHRNAIMHSVSGAHLFLPGFGISSMTIKFMSGKPGAVENIAWW